MCSTPTADSKLPEWTNVTKGKWRSWGWFDSLTSIPRVGFLRAPPNRPGCHASWRCSNEMGWLAESGQVRLREGHGKKRKRRRPPLHIGLSRRSAYLAFGSPSCYNSRPMDTIATSPFHQLRPCWPRSDVTQTRPTNQSCWQIWRRRWSGGRNLFWRTSFVGPFSLHTPQETLSKIWFRLKTEPCCFNSLGPTALLSIPT